MRTVPVALAGLLIAASVSGQAWLPRKGEGSLTLNPQFLFVKDHIAFNGQRNDSGHIRANSARLELTYGLTDRLTVSGDAMYVWSKYEGHCPKCIPHGPPDDYSYNGGFQDARIDVLYALARGRIAFTPAMRVVIPLSNYSPQGHSAIGRHLHEISGGAFAGTDFGPFAPDAFIQAGYSYSVVEHVQGISTNRSNGELELGYVVTSSLSLLAMGLWRDTYGGFDLPRDFEHEGGFDIHDRVARSQYIRFGWGAAYALSRSTVLNVMLLKTYSGRSTYGSRGISTGITWNFGRSSAPLTTADDRGR